MLNFSNQPCSAPTYHPYSENNPLSINLFPPTNFCFTPVRTLLRNSCYEIYPIPLNQIPFALVTLGICFHLTFPNNSAALPPCHPATLLLFLFLFQSCSNPVPGPLPAPVRSCPRSFQQLLVTVSPAFTPVCFSTCSYSCRPYSNRSCPCNNFPFPLPSHTCTCLPSFLHCRRRHC